MKVGFIGLGSMGTAIATRVLDAGHKLTVWNRSPQRLAELIARGAVAARSPEDALQGDCLVSMLSDDAAIRAVGLDGQMLTHATPGLIHVNMATISVAFAQQLAAAHDARGLSYVAAPVFGRPEAVVAGNLVIAAAGAPSSLAILEPLFAVIGRRTAVVGEAPEQANLFKLAGNFMLTAAVEAMGEAFALLRKGGVDPALFHEVLTGGLFTGPVYQGYGGRIVAGTFTPPGFALKLAAKDVGLARTAASDLQVPMPLAELVHDHFMDAMALGFGEQDLAALARVIAAQAGLPSGD
jgi:3-hydroxyisobutyrate dehydrogenase-like beta-hydroxyacid dehydrogenase